MKNNITLLFNYKGKDIIIREYKDRFQIGIRGESGIAIWFDKVRYNTLQLAKTSGREYARIVIDRMLVSKKKGTNSYDKK